MRKQTDHTFELLKHFVVNYLVTSLNSEFDDQSDNYMWIDVICGHSYLLYFSVHLNFKITYTIILFLEHHLCCKNCKHFIIFPIILISILK